ncbi:MAG: hypothetical protein JZU65_19670 [Chlorobium sp.]|nr:hypothetical protein [Chlorobium sp.]
MSHRDRLNELQILGKLKNNWYSVAGVAEGIINAGGELLPRRMRDAAEASGLSMNTLKRMLSVRAFLDSVKDQIPDIHQGMDPNKLSYPNLELVKRLYQVNQEQGISMLTEVVRGEITFRELRERYNQLVSENISGASSQQIARIEERDFAASALAAIKSAAHEIFSGLIITIDGPRQMPLPIDAIAYEFSFEDTDLPYAGFEFINYREQANWKQILETLQYRTIFSSYFFKRYWVVFSENSGSACVTAFTKILIELGCPSIGIAVIPLDAGSLKIIHAPTGDPIQDWSGKIERYRKLREGLLNSKYRSGGISKIP